MSVEEIRNEVSELCDIVQAILAFNYHFTPAERDDLDGIRRSLPELQSKSLRNCRSYLSRRIKEASATFGLIQPPRKFSQWFKANYQGKNGILQMPKCVIDSQYCANFGGTKELSKKFPPHAMIFLDYEARLRPLYPEYYLAEAALYEDMCGAFNLAVETERSGRGAVIDKLKIKQHALHCRTSVLNAYYFVEAYLNGLAFDFYIENAKAISTDDSDLLLEWNSKTNKESLRNFRTKALQYPRIVLGAAHPPLTETNSKNLALLLSDGKEIRDSIVHQNPKVVAGDMPKLRAFLRTGLREASAVVDAAVGFVFDLNAVLGKYSMKLNWLFKRDKNGRFPDESFQ